jgi:SPP1 family predicted phage head-tail adaptor
LATIWGELAPITRLTSVATTNYNRRLTHQITVRYRDDITTGQRLVFGSRLFFIRAVINSAETNQWLVLMVEEGGILE